MSICALARDDTCPDCIFRLDELDEGSEIQEYLAEKTGQRTVPNIFISKYMSFDKLVL